MSQRNSLEAGESKTQMTSDQSAERNLMQTQHCADLNGKFIEEEGFGLRRTWGLWSSISINIGAIIGSGIFISPKGVLGWSGSIGASLIIWAASGVISFFAGLCYAELSTLIRKSSGEFIYLKVAYGGGLAFMYGFITVFVMKPVVKAILALTCSTYILAAINGGQCEGQTIVAIKLLGVALALLAAALNMASVDISRSVQTFFTVVKLSGLAIIIIGGIVMLAKGYTENFTNAFEGTSTQAANIVLAFYSGFFSFGGWQTITVIAEEVKDPQRNIPLSMIVSVLTAIVIYVTVNVSYYSAMNKDQMLASPAVAITWSETVLPSAVWVMSALVALSAFGSLTISTLSGGRVTYRMAREGQLASIFGMVQINRFTPFTALILNACVTVAYIIPGDIQNLLDMLGFIHWTINALVFLGLIVLRFRQRDAHRPFKVPIVIPAMMTFLSLFFTLAPLIQERRFEYVYGLLMFFGSLVFYFPLVYFKLRLPAIDYFTRLMQRLFQVAPSEIEK